MFCKDLMLSLKILQHLLVRLSKHAIVILYDMLNIILIDIMDDMEKRGIPSAVLSYVRIGFSLRSTAPEWKHRRIIAPKEFILYLCWYTVFFVMFVWYFTIIMEACQDDGKSMANRIVDLKFIFEYARC